MIVLAVFAPLIAPHSSTEASIKDKLLPPFWMEGASRDHPLGTDLYGRDIMSRLIFGTRVALSVSFLALMVSGILGTVLGMMAGYYGGRLDMLLMRIVDIALSMPLILMAVVLAVVLGPSYANTILVIGLLLWPKYARQIRGEVLGIKEQDFVALARVAGCSGLRIMWRHIFPNVLPTFLVILTLQAGYVILLEGSLSFLGVGIPPPTAAWGAMVADGRGLLATAWWVSMLPGIAILLAVLSLNLLGDYVRDRLDPRLRQI
ncbi:MAG: ABC transporter permease [Chloroflexi bacterium]|nr:ABC transporter permease [Chloroflexota bacterium]